MIDLEIGTTTFTATYSTLTSQCIVIRYILFDTASADDSSNLFGGGYALRNSGSNTIAWNSDGYYTITTHSSGERESMRVLTPLTGSTDFCLEYDSYAEQDSGTSGLVVYSSSTDWAKLTDNVEGSKRTWYAYSRSGRFYETGYYSSKTTYQRWVHYKFTLVNKQFTIRISEIETDEVLWEHTETIHFSRDVNTEYGLNSEWGSNRTTRYKNLKAYLV